MTIITPRVNPVNVTCGSVVCALVFPSKSFMVTILDKNWSLLFP